MYVGSRRSIKVQVDNDRVRNARVVNVHGEGVMSRSGWEKDGSGLLVFRCKGKTWCPEVREQTPMHVRFMAEYAAYLLRVKRKYRHQPHGGPAENAKRKWYMKDRRWLRRAFVKFKKKPLATNPTVQDKRYHMRKRFEGRPARDRV